LIAFIYKSFAANLAILTKKGKPQADCSSEGPRWQWLKRQGIPATIQVFERPIKQRPEYASLPAPDP